MSEIPIDNKFSTLEVDNLHVNTYHEIINKTEELSTDKTLTKEDNNTHYFIDLSEDITITSPTDNISGLIYKFIFTNSVAEKRLTINNTINDSIIGHVYIDNDLKQKPGKMITIINENTNENKLHGSRISIISRKGTTNVEYYILDDGIALDGALHISNASPP